MDLALEGYCVLRVRSLYNQRVTHIPKQSLFGPSILVMITM
jgi:hypothetical protein